MVEGQNMPKDDWAPTRRRNAIRRARTPDPYAKPGQPKPARQPAKPVVAHDQVMDEIASMHAAVKAMRPATGTEAYRLLCSLGSHLGNGVRKPSALEVLRRRFKAVMDQLG